MGFKKKQVTLHTSYCIHNFYTYIYIYKSYFIHTVCLSSELFSHKGGFLGGRGLVCLLLRCNQRKWLVPHQLTHPQLRSLIGWFSALGSAPAALESGRDPVLVRKP